MKVFRLEANMRVKRLATRDAATYENSASDLLDIGNGVGHRAGDVANGARTFEVPKNMIVKGAAFDTRDVTTLLEFFCGKLGTNAVASSCCNLWDKGISCPRNKDVNDTAMRLFGMYLPEPPATHTYTRAYAHTELPDGEAMPVTTEA
eukprot:27278-Chlamydomonas_euryale.AAC.1